jgi:hypothetical protein
VAASAGGAVSFFSWAHKQPATKTKARNNVFEGMAFLGRISVLRRNQSGAEKDAVLFNHPTRERAISLPILTYVKEELGQSVAIWGANAGIRGHSRCIHDAGCVLLPKSAFCTRRTQEQIGERKNDGGTL